MNKLLGSDQELEKVWRAALTFIRGEVPEQQFNIWIEPTQLAAFDGCQATIAVPDKFYANWLAEHFSSVIRRALEGASGDSVTLAFSIRERVQKSPPPPAPLPSRRVVCSPWSQELNGRYTFDDFVVGPGNHFAHAAAFAVSDLPGRHYNPLFIYGSVGLGKTHLMQAIAQRALVKNSNLKACYLTSEKFTNELITAIQTRTTRQFRERYRSLDLLLIDDIHFIRGKESTQEEFFHTFNTLYDAHHQIVITSDRPPREIPALEERLVSRFAWGLVTDIQPPDFETRVAILRKKMGKETVRVSDEVVQFIASKIRSNIRELEGALIRVVAYASLSGRAADLALAQDVLRDSLSEEESKISIDLIQRKVAEHFHLKLSDMRVRSRTQSVALARQIAMYLARDLTSHSLTEIGDFFGGRNHATVIHAHQRVAKEMTVNGELRSRIEAIRGRIRSDSC
jgi:chromosomal replication initiator protein